MISPNEILPDELIERLDQLGNDLDKNKWIVGDIADDLCRQLDNYKAGLVDGNKIQLRNAAQCTHEDIYNAIAYPLGASLHTVRGYREISSFWPPDHRDEFPMFKRNHVKVAKGFAEGETVEEKRANARELLWQCLAEHNHVPSVRQLTAWLHQEKPEPMWYKYIDR